MGVRLMMFGFSSLFSSPHSTNVVDCTWPAGKVAAGGKQLAFQHSPQFPLAVTSSPTDAFEKLKCVFRKINC
jgi:hypothetical protein